MATLPTASENAPYPKPIETAAAPFPFCCAMCGREAWGTVYQVRLGPMPPVAWLRLPDGWWLLLPNFVTDGTDLSKIHARCPDCLRTGADELSAVPRDEVLLGKKEQAMGEQSWKARLRATLGSALLEAERHAAYSDRIAFQILESLLVDAGVENAEHINYMDRARGTRTRDGI